MAEPDLVGRKSEEDGVETLILRHPPVNSLSTQVLEELDAHLKRVASQPGTRCVVP